MAHPVTGPAAGLPGVREPRPTRDDARMDRIHEDLRRVEAGLRAASREAAAAMDTAPYLPSRVEVRAAFEAADPEGLLGMAADLAAVADPGLFAEVTARLCSRMLAVHGEQEARLPRRVLVPPAGQLPATG